MYDNYNSQTYEINGDNIVYKDNLDSEYPPNPQQLPNDNLYNNTDTEPPLLYSLNIFFSLALFTFTSIQLARCYYKLENYIRNQRNQRQNNIRRPLNRNRNGNVDINSINTLVVCDELPDNICSVCLDEFKEDDILKKLNCEHIFHKDCLEPWLNNNNRNCPLCKTDII